MKNKHFLPFICFCILSLFSGCDMIAGGGDDEGKALTCADILGTSTIFDLVSINGQDLPYEAYYEDSNNNSYVTSGLFSFTDENTAQDPRWRSSLTNEKVVNGNKETENIVRSGTFTCSEGEVRLTNEQNGAGGTGILEGNTFILGHDSGFETVFKAL